LWISDRPVTSTEVLDWAFARKRHPRGALPGWCYTRVAGRLREAGAVRVGRAEDKPGRPYLWALTERISSDKPNNSNKPEDKK
jgi:hypothetical protein